MQAKGKVAIERLPNGTFNLIYTVGNSILANLSIEDFKRLHKSMSWWVGRMCPRCDTHLEFTRTGQMRDVYYCPRCGYKDVY